VKILPAEALKPLDIQENHLLSSENPPAENVKEQERERERKRKRKKCLLSLLTLDLSKSGKNS